MATNTPNLNLVKPEMADYADIRVLNGNMDILDREVGGLDYVKNVVTSDTGLTFTKKDDTEINVPLNYLPITGGNLTGDVTIKNNAVVYPVEIIDKREATNVFNTTKNENNQNDINGDYYKIVKYSDGTMRLDACYSMQYDDFSGSAKPITFPTPFANNKLFVQCSSLDQKEDQYYCNYVTARVSATGMYIYNNFNSEDRLMVSVIGEWK